MGPNVSVLIHRLIWIHSTEWDSTLLATNDCMEQPHPHPKKLWTVYGRFYQVPLRWIPSSCSGLHSPPELFGCLFSSTIVVENKKVEIESCRLWRHALRQPSWVCVPGELFSHETPIPNPAQLLRGPRSCTLQCNLGLSLWKPTIRSRPAPSSRSPGILHPRGEA